MTKYVIFDIDDTLVSNPDFNNLFPKEDTRESWDKYYQLIDYHKYVKINKNMVELVKLLATKYIILFVTSRENVPNTPIEDYTYNTLYDMFGDNMQYYNPENNTKHLQANNIVVFRLFMRGYNDFRPSSDVKEDLFLLHGFNPHDIVAVYDDNIDNIKMFQKYKINTNLITLGDNNEDL